MNNFEFKKSLGQNFINDNNIIVKMIKDIDIDKDTMVVEIGPGAGVLSKNIIPKSKYSLLYEIDTRLKDILDNELKEFDNYKLIFNDFLNVDLRKDLSNYSYNKLYVVANLPYYITTPIILKILEQVIPDRIVIMIQKEVADRLSSRVNSKDYGYITVYLNYFYNIKKLFNVSRNCFTPSPSVDSAVIMMDKIDREVKVVNFEVFDKLIKDSFQYKRKNLRNNLKCYNLDVIERVLSKYNLKLTDRAENVSVDIFIDIANELVK